MDKKMLNRKITLWYVLFVIVVVGVTGLVFWKITAKDGADMNNVAAIDSFESCEAAGYPIMESYPRQCNVPGGETFTESLGYQEYSSDKGVAIRLSQPQRKDLLSSPYIIKGEVPGNWSFEASFPIVLTNWDGLIIAEAIAQLQGEWMTEEYVPFEAIIEFTAPDFGNNGFLILQKNNPSDLSDNDDALEIEILFR